MAEIVPFPNESAAFCERDTPDQLAEDRFLLEEGLELLADFRCIPDRDVRTALRALVKSLACESSQPTS